MVAAISPSRNVWVTNSPVNLQLLQPTPCCPQGNTATVCPPQCSSPVLQKQPVPSAAAPLPSVCPGREAMNWRGAAPTFFLTGTTCLRKGTGLLADISNGLETRKTYLERSRHQNEAQANMVGGQLNNTGPSTDPQGHHQ